MKRLFPGLLLAVLLAGCGASDDEAVGPAPRYRIPGCAHFDTAPCGVLDAGCQSRLLGIAACLRETEPGEVPPVTVMTEAAYASYLAEDRAMPLPSEFETAFVLLGLVAPGAFDPNSVDQELVQSIAGFYRNDEKDVVIIDHGSDSDDASASSTLVHEFIHVLQDRAGDLERIFDATDDYLDPVLAGRAVFEGEARWHQLRYAAAMLGIDPRAVDWQRTLQNRLQRTEAWVFEQPSRLMAGRLALPYEWGAHYLFFDWRSAGQAGIAAHFTSPPATTHALMASVDAVVDDDFTPSRPDAAEPPEGWEYLGDEVLGSFGTFLLLGQVASHDDARDLSLHWRGDRLLVYRVAVDDGSATAAAFVWYADFSSHEAALDVAGYISEVLGSGTVQVVDVRMFVGLGERTLDFDWADPSK